MPSLSVLAVIPAYNEAPTIARIAAAALPSVDRVLVVDDGSSDGTGDSAAQAGADVVRLERNSGKGVALRAGLSWARQRSEVAWAVLLDADGQHDPAAIPRLVERARSLNADILVGSRFLGVTNAPRYRLFGLHILSASAALGSGVRMTDSQSGYRVLSRRAIDALELREDGFAVESEMQFEAARLGLRVAETPIEIRYDGAARRSPVGHGVAVLIRTILMVARRRPLRLPLLVLAPIVSIEMALTKSIGQSADVA